MKKYYLDIETYKKVGSEYKECLDTNEFYCGAMMEDTGECYFYTDKNMMRNSILNIMRSQKNVAMIAHNHVYDFLGIFKDDLKELINTEQLDIIRERPFLAIFKAEPNRWNWFLDSMGFFPMSLKDLGDLIDLPKKERKEAVTDPYQLKDYVVRDVEILKVAFEKLLKLIEELDYKPRKFLTIGDLSMKLLIREMRKSSKQGYYMKRGKIHGVKENIPFLRKASKGGRVEVFREGSFKGSMVDINSAYWESMKKMTFPDLLKEKTYTGQECNEIGYKTILRFTGVIQARLKIEKYQKFGVLPVRTNIISEKSYKLEFPRTGEVEGYWTTLEVNEAIKRGYKLLEINKAVIWTQNMNENILADFIDRLYKLRTKYKDSRFESKMMKLLGNSLYGKFLQKSTRKEYKWIPRKDLDKYVEKGWEIQSVQDDYCIGRELEEYIPNHSTVIIGVLITSHCRIALLRALEKIDNPLYCDTDSIIMEGEDFWKLNLGLGLGEFKIEARNEEGYILREKGYHIGEKVVLSRIRKENRTIENIRHGKTKEVVQDEMYTIKKGIKTGDFHKIGTFYKKGIKLTNK